MSRKINASTENFKPQSKTDIKARILAANDESPIAVFTIMRDDVKHLTAVFADTRHTYQLILNKHPDLVGVFHRGSDFSEVKAKLNAALKG
jgi:hypothetical protein